MKAPVLVALACSLALLRVAAGACSAESQCVSTACGASYGEATAKTFPYWVDYTSTADKVATTFHFKVCSSACRKDKSTCQPLEAFRLRISDTILSNAADYIMMAEPAGSASATCDAGGPGWFMKGTDLLSLARVAPYQGESCEVFTLSIYNPPGAMGALALSDVCQQGVVVQNDAGDVIFDQSKAGRSCLYTLELQSGDTAVGALKQHGPGGPPLGKPDPSPAPASPSPSPSPAAEPSTPAEQPSPSPSPRPHRRPPPRPAGYYGGGGYAGRRLSGLGFPRSLLHSQYYYSAGSHRRLMGAEPAALAFATRRLLDASAVPLPLHLAGSAAGLPSAQRSLLWSSYGYGYSGRHALSVNTGRALQTSSQYGYYGGSHHRRLSSIDSEAGWGRTLLHGGSHGYYGGGYGGHARRLSGVEPDASWGRSLLHGGSHGHGHGYYGGYSTGHRRSLMSVGAEEAGWARSLLHSGSHGYYGGGYGGHRRAMLHYGGHAGGYYGGSGHRRSLMGAADGAVGRTLLHGYYGGYGHHH